VNRFFEFTPRQIKLLLVLTGILLIGTTLKFVHSYATVNDEALSFSVNVGDGNLQYQAVFQVDLNLSPSDSLELIPGIGPVLASRIVTYRDRVGKFETVEDIMKVQGIGRSKYEKIKSYITVRNW